MRLLKSKTATSCPAGKYFCGVAQMSLRASITCPSFFVANKSNIQTPVSPSRRRCLHRTLVSLSRPACTIPWSLHCICIVSLLGDRAASKLPSRPPSAAPPWYQRGGHAHATPGRRTYLLGTFQRSRCANVHLRRYHRCPEALQQ